MIVKKRNFDLSYKRDIKADKVSIVLDWLLEFRFSSLDILGSRLELSTSNCYKFFAMLIKEDIVQEFKNVHTRGTRYVMLTKTSVSYLEADGRDISKAVVRSDRLGRHSTIVHDMAVQKSALALIKEYDCDQLVWDRNIEYEGERPDLLFHSPKGYWGALEYERWKKKEPQIYRIFRFHVDSIVESRYSAIFYYFDQIADMKAYQSLFNKSEWPTFSRDRVGRWKVQKDVFKPSSIEGLESRFKFVHYPVA